jgi:hypothetical protein
MPQGHRARAVDELEMLDMDEPTVPEPIEPAVEPDATDEEEEEYEETITIKALYLLAYIERDAHQVQLEAEERFEAHEGIWPEP